MQIVKKDPNEGFKLDPEKVWAKSRSIVNLKLIPKRFSAARIYSHDFLIAALSLSTKSIPQHFDLYRGWQAYQLNICKHKEMSSMI